MVMKLIEATNEIKLTEKKLEAHLEFIRKYSSRPSIRVDAFEGQEKAKVQEKVQACMDLITRHEWLRRAITYTNLVSAVEVNGKTYSIHALIQHKSKKSMLGYGTDAKGICDLKRKVYAALDDRATFQEVDKIRASQGKDAAINVQVIHNFDIEAVGKAKMDIEELDMAIDSALQVANAKLDLIDPPNEFKQKA